LFKSIAVIVAKICKIRRELTPTRSEGDAALSMRELAPVAGEIHLLQPWLR